MIEFLLCFWLMSCMPAGPSNAELLRRLPYIVAFDAFNSVFCQLSVLGAAVFGTFMVTLGLREDQIGLVWSLVNFASIGAIFLAPLSARIGVKRVFVTFWGTRNVFAGGVILTPWMFWWYGLDAAFLYLVAMMACFSICRAFGEAATTQWRQEIIPPNVRGRFSAINNIVFTFLSVLALLVAKAVIKPNNLIPYVYLMAVGTAIGFASIFWASLMPGGVQIQEKRDVTWHLRRFRKTVTDRNFLLYTAAMSLVALGTAPLGAFVTPYLINEMGVRADDVVLLSTGALIGTLVSSYVWGWAADRYGSKPVILLSLMLLVLPPIGWLLLPRGSWLTGPVAMAIFFVSGVASIGYGLGTGRQLYVTIVPYRRKTHYMSVFCAWMGAVNGTAQLLAGKSLSFMPDISHTYGFVTIGRYSCLFAFCILVLLVSLWLQQRVQADGSLSMRRFVGMFLQGNPLLAAESLVRYGRAGDDPTRVHMIGRLARSGSPLSEDELIEALQDPSFQVRYEAITAIARRSCGARLTGEVIETLISGQPDMSVAAAWALSRSASPSALAPLRWTFSAGSPLLRLRSARALASLGDKQILPELERQAAAQPDLRLQQAYQSVLAGLRLRQAGQGGLLEGPRPAIRCQMKHVLAALQSGDCDLRCQAVVLASQLTGRPELTDALIDLLERGEVDLSLEAAWALSRIGDQRAVPALLKAFDCDYPLLSARAARALAHLGCRQIVPELCRRLQEPGEIGIQIAYAAALGRLRAVGALPAVLALYARVPNQLWSRELDLAVARLIGQERTYIQLWRRMRKESATQAARALHPLVKSLHRRALHLADSLRICLDQLSDQNLPAGCASMAGLLAALPQELFSPQSRQVRDHCQVFLTRQGPMQAECLPLAIACLKSALG